MHTTVTIPLLNPNEPEALLVSLPISEGQQVAQGDRLCTLETTKSTADLLAEASGYIVGLRAEKGQMLRAGEMLCFLAESPTWRPPVEPVAHLVGDEIETHATSSTADIPSNLRITQPALSLVRQARIGFDQLPRDRLVTESLVRSLLESLPISTQEKGARGEAALFDPTAILIFGGGGHGKTLIELLRALHTYRLVGVVDDGMHSGDTVLDVPVLGGAEVLPDVYAQGVRLAVNAVGGIGNVSVRIRVFQKLSQAGFVCPALVHPAAFVEPSAYLSPGVQVFAHAYIGSAARLGFGCIVNTGAIVSHDCILGDYANISPGAMLAGEVQIGSSVLIGMGATVNLRVKVGATARIGNGSTVKEDVPEKSIVRAGALWPG